MLKGLFIKMLAIRAFTNFTVQSDSLNTSEFRTTGYYLIYRFSNGQRELISCPWILSNAIGGYGVCGWYTEYKNVKKLSFKFKKVRVFFWKNEREKDYNWFKIRFYLFKKQGADYEETQRKLLDIAVHRACKSFKRKKTRPTTSNAL